jgi:hypothetical protein
MSDVPECKPIRLTSHCSLMQGIILTLIVFAKQSQKSNLELHEHD